jgi:hypothetical protein
MRILVANEPRSYREAIAGAVQVLRPHLAVITVEPEDLDEEVVRHDPGLVLCSRLSRVVESWPCAWVVLYPDGETRAMVSIAGRRRTVTADLPFASLLSLIDETEHLTLTGG